MRSELDALWNETIAYLGEFSAEFRRGWVGKAVRSTPVLSRMFGTDPALEHWLACEVGSDPAGLRRVWPEQDPAHTAGLLRELITVLSEFRRCARECRKVVLVFKHWLRWTNPRMSWRDGLSEAIAETPGFTELEHNDAKVAQWLREIPTRSAPPFLDEITPPLTWKQLQTLRRALDRLRQSNRRKKLEPEEILLAPDDIATLSDFDVLRDFENQLDGDWDDSDDERLRKCLGRLSYDDLATFRLKLDNFKQVDIAEIVGISDAAVTRRLVKIIDILAICVREAD